MFSLTYLNSLRAEELRFYLPYFPAGARVLEIGGGTGEQARGLAAAGFDVASIDIPNSDYRTGRIFPIIDYDGRSIPFPTASFDAVFSSNVMEHVRDPAALHSEIRRVLKPGAYAVHAMPSAAWRVWTTLANYGELAQILGTNLPELVPRGFDGTARHRVLGAARRIFHALITHACPPRHGEIGIMPTEVLTFSRWWWRRHFHRHGYELLAVRPMGLFYTGHMVFGSGLSFAARRRLARWFGSAAVLYQVRPIDRAT